MMEKNTLIIINRLSSGASKLDEERLKRYFGEAETFYVTDTECNPPDEKYKRVIACGGDGTLNRLVNGYGGAELYYVPCGTFNETAKCALKNDGKLSVVGCASGKLFTYVLATGTFTPLGYAVDTKSKQRLKILAYVFKVIREYKVTRIKASVTANDVTQSGEFSLIMLSNSKRCFGFNFNRLYKHNNDNIQLLTIKSPRFNGLLGCIEMFFPFFRAFFAGFSSEYESKHVRFVNVKEACIRLEAETPFCADGDKWILSGEIKAAPQVLTPPVTIVSKKEFT